MKEKKKINTNGKNSDEQMRDKSKSGRKNDRFKKSKDR